MKTKRMQICYVVFMFIYFVVLCVLKRLCALGLIAQVLVEWMALVFSFLLFLPVVIWCGGYVLRYFVRSIKNIHSCGDEVFDELDYYSIHWGVTKEFYINQISIVNFYYKEGGKIDTVVGSDLKRLFNRYEYLKRGLNTKEYMITCLSSVGLSICATIFFEYMYGEFVNNGWYAILYMLAFFAIILLRYFDTFIDESNQIYEHELKLLEKKISAAIDKYSYVEYKREDILLTKQNLLVLLMKQCKFLHGRKSKNIECDIRKVEKLDLYIDENNGYKELRFQMGKTNKQGILYMDENNKMVNEQYEILYNILRKYDLIYELNEDS